MTAIMRLPSAAYVVQKTLDPDSVSHRNATIGSWPTAIKVVEDLERAGWRLIPARLPQLRHEEPEDEEERGANSPMTEGEITSRQLIQAAAVFDGMDEEPFPAADFVAWVVSETRGTPENRWLEQRRLR